MPWEESNKTDLSGNSSTELAEERKPLLQQQTGGDGGGSNAAISSFQTTTFIRARKPARFVVSC